MPSHDPERAWVQSRIADLDHRLDQTAAEMASALDLYRDDWSTSTNEMMRAHAEQMQRLRDDQAAWLANFTNGEAGEPAPTQDVGQGHGASATGPAPAPGPGPGQPNPHAAELAEAERIRNLSLQDFAVERERLIRSRTSRGMFG